MTLGRVFTVTIGYFNSHSIITKIWSSFSKDGVCKLFVHMNCLSDSSNSLKSKLFITILNKNDHLSLYLSLFFSCGLLFITTLNTMRACVSKYMDT
jgi:hypothetical protein